MNRSKSVSATNIRRSYRVTESFIDSTLGSEVQYLEVLSIREEIIGNAMAECEKSCMKKQSVKYLLGCLHDAYIDLFTAIYMHYDQHIIEDPNLWKSEDESAPLPIDNYAEFSIPLERTSIAEIDVEEDSDRNIAEAHAESLTNAFLSSAIESEPTENPDLICPLFEEVVHPSMGEESLYRNPTEWIGDQEEMKASYASSSTELYQELSSETSFFTGVAEAPMHFLPQIEETRCENPLVKTVAPVEKTTVTSIMRKSMDTSLPPLRLRGRFKSADEVSSTASSMKAIMSGYKVYQKPSTSMKEDSRNDDIDSKLLKEKRSSAMDESDQFTAHYERVEEKEDSIDSDH